MRGLVAVLRSQQGQTPLCLCILARSSAQRALPQCACARVSAAAVLKSISVQKERQKKLEQTVEEKLKQEETTTLKKQQALKACLSSDGFRGREPTGRKGKGLFSGDGKDKKDRWG